MNLLKTTTAALTLFAAAATANAIPVQYHFAGVFDEETSNAPIGPGDYLFNTSSTFTGEFMYDAAAIGTVNGDDSLIKAIYPTAVSLLIGSVDGHLFGSAADVTLFTQSCVGACPPPVTLSMSISPTDPNPLGFTIGNFKLEGWQVLLYSTLTDTNLPQPLGKDETATLFLIFSDNQDNQRSVTFTLTEVTPVTPVPLPASGLLLGGGLAGLALKNLRRLRKNRESASA